jgi:hypothetical protein
MNKPQPRYWLLIVEGDVEPFVIGPLDAPDLLVRAREHRANDPSEEDGLYVLALDAQGHLSIETFASAAFESQG